MAEIVEIPMAMLYVLKSISTISKKTVTIHTVHLYVYMYRSSDTENCEGWLSPGGHSSGGRALTAKVRGPRFNPGWLPVFHSSIPEPFHHVHVHVHIHCTLLASYPGLQHREGLGREGLGMRLCTLHCTCIQDVDRWRKNEEHLHQTGRKEGGMGREAVRERKGRGGEGERR